MERREIFLAVDPHKTLLQDDFRKEKKNVSRNFIRQPFCPQHPILEPVTLPADSFEGPDTEFRLQGLDHKAHGSNWRALDFR